MIHTALLQLTFLATMTRRTELAIAGVVVGIESMSLFDVIEFM